MVDMIDEFDIGMSRFGSFDPYNRYSNFDKHYRSADTPTAHNEKFSSPKKEQTNQNTNEELTPWFHHSDRCYFLKFKGQPDGPKVAHLWYKPEIKMWCAYSPYLSSNPFEFKEIQNPDYDELIHGRQFYIERKAFHEAQRELWTAFCERGYQQPSGQIINLKIVADKLVNSPENVTYEERNYLLYSNHDSVIRTHNSLHTGSKMPIQTENAMSSENGCSGQDAKRLLTPLLHHGDRCYYIKRVGVPNSSPVAWLWYKPEIETWCSYSTVLPACESDRSPFKWVANPSFDPNRHGKNYYREGSDFQVEKENLVKRLRGNGFKFESLLSINLETVADTINQNPEKLSEKWRGYLSYSIYPISKKACKDKVVAKQQLENAFNSPEENDNINHSRKENTKQPNQKREKEMSHKTKSTRDVFANSFTHGAQVALSDEAADLLLNMAEQLVGESYPELAKTERGKDVVKLLSATLLHYAATNYPDFVPQACNVSTACGLVIEASTRDMIQPQLSKLEPIFHKLGAVGAKAVHTNDSGPDKESDQ